LQRRLIAVQLK